MQSWEKNPHVSPATYSRYLLAQTPWFLALSEIPKKQEKKAYYGKIKVLFVGGKSPDNEKSNELLSRIIQAMKLKKDEFALCQNPRDVFLNMEDYLPLVIVSFGAIATNALLESKERLSKTHGKFIKKAFPYGTKTWICPIVPIFHPDFLTINPSMKRTTWHDLKQVMGFIARNT